MAKQDGMVMIRIYTLFGEVAWEKEVSAVQGLNYEIWAKVNMDGELVGSGPYLVRIKGSGLSDNFRIVVEK
jgi:hypothetical protein